MADLQRLSIHGHLEDFFRNHKLGFGSIVHHNGQFVIIVIYIRIVRMAVHNDGRIVLGRADQSCVGTVMQACGDGDPHQPHKKSCPKPHTLRSTQDQKHGQNSGHGQDAGQPAKARIDFLQDKTAPNVIDLPDVNEANQQGRD